MEKILKTITGKRFSVTLLLMAAVGFFNMLSAQTFEQAKDYAFNGERAKSRVICRAMLADGFDSDVAILMGRTYAWDSQYDSARVVLQEVLTYNAENSDALSALADVEYWDGNYPQALEYCNRILAKDPQDQTVQFQKARILNSADQYEEAARVLENILEQNSAHSDALRLLEKVRMELIKNKITLNYSFDYFNNAAYDKDPWQLTYLQYSRKTGLGTVIGRVNYANRFGSDALQFEVDAYPKISENNYMYLNYGFSNMSGFPSQRGGLEWHRSFPRSFEGSLGARLLHFEGSKSVIIYTGSIGKYLGNYWVSLRPYVTPGSDGTSVSASVSVRRYFSDPENYIGLRVGAGSSPDERRLLLNDPNLRSRLESQSVKLSFNHLLSSQWIISTDVALANEEYWSPSESIIKTGNIYSFQIGFAYLF